MLWCRSTGGDLLLVVSTTPWVRDLFQVPTYSRCLDRIKVRPDFKLVPNAVMHPEAMRQKGAIV